MIAAPMVIEPATAPATVTVGSLLEPVATLVSWTGSSPSAPSRLRPKPVALVVFPKNVTSMDNDDSVVGLPRYHVSALHSEVASGAPAACVSGVPP